MAILENLFAKNFKMTKPRKFCTLKISQYTVVHKDVMQTCEGRHAGASSNKDRVIYIRAT